MRIFAPKRDASHAAFSSIVVDAETAILEMRAEPLETGQDIADCASQARLA